MNAQIFNLINSYNNSEDKIYYFRNLPSLQKSLVLFGVSKKFKLEILNKLTDDEILDIFKYLDPDEITDILQVLSTRKQKKIILKLNKTHKSKVDFLMKFAPKSAAGIMGLNYIIVSVFDTKKEILNRLEKHLNLGKKEPTILVEDEIGNFIGEIRISNLLFKKSENLFENLIILPTVIYNQDQEDVIDIFRKNKQRKIVVFGENNSILGIIHAKDIFKIVEAEDTEDLYGIAGLDKEEDISDGVLNKVKFRIWWLILNLFTAFLAAWVVTLFDSTISKFVLLAAFMPIIAGMGGNAATQTTTILLRSLALRKINSKQVKSILGKEIVASIINGFIVGLIVALMAYMFDENLLFGLITGLAIVLNMFVAAFFGTIVPVLLKALGLDPAVSSSVFVTTATDVFGFLIFLGLASIFLI